MPANENQHSADRSQATQCIQFFNGHRQRMRRSTRGARIFEHWKLGSALPERRRHRLSSAKQKSCEPSRSPADFLEMSLTMPAQLYLRLIDRQGATEMANIVITVSNDLYEIVMDVHDWTSLVVNGVNVNVSNDQFKWQQSKPGTLNFTAMANTGPTVQTPQFKFAFNDGREIQVAELDFQQVNSAFILNGSLYVDNNTLVPIGFPPFYFSQPKMTGTYTGAVPV
jgi:hypothetical protein